LSRNTTQGNVNAGGIYVYIYIWPENFVKIIWDERTATFPCHLFDNFFN
jgi:hypothetical protein